MGRVLEWVERNGGVEGMAKLAAKKAALVYDTVEQSNGFYSVPVAKNARSKMNVPFRIGSPANEDLEKEFLKGAEALGLIQLKGHRYVRRHFTYYFHLPILFDQSNESFSIIIDWNVNGLIRVSTFHKNNVGFTIIFFRAL